MKINTTTALFLLVALLTQTFSAHGAEKAEYKELKDIPYRTAGDEYALERCKLDIYYPETAPADGAPVVVWFHGGGLTGGQKEIPERLRHAGYVVMAPNYRLLPKVEIDGTLDDAAAAVEWAFRNCRDYGGSPEKIFVTGHSAGGYLTAMLGLDKSLLDAYGIDADSIAGLIPFSAQTISHFSYRDMNGIGNLQPTIDKYAPLFHVRKDAPPLILITGDREQEIFGRYEENAYLWRMMRLNGHPETYIYEIGGHDHGAMVEPSFHILRQWIDRILRSRIPSPTQSGK